MRLLLDTNALLVALRWPERLRADTRGALEDPSNDVFVSAVSPWEIEIKRATGKLTAPDDVIGAIDRAGYQPLWISLAHGVAAGRLPRHHDDPFDRLLIAQAQLEGLTIVTTDRDFRDYQVALLSA